MKKSKDLVKLSNVTSLGKYLYCYSDKFNIYLFFSDFTDHVIYKVTCDKYFCVTEVDEITLPFEYNKNLDIRFFKPIESTDGVYKYVGIVDINNTTSKFEIDNSNNLKLSTTTVKNNRKLFTIISCLDDIEVDTYIQSKNKIYIIGFDTINKVNAYGVVDIESNKFLVYYLLYSDLGDVEPISINLDSSEEKVYIVGSINKYDDKDNLIETIPYLEAFMLV